MKFEEVFKQYLEREYEALKAVNARLTPEYLALLQSYGISTQEDPQDSTGRRRRSDSPSS